MQVSGFMARPDSPPVPRRGRTLPVRQSGQVLSPQQVGIALGGLSEDPADDRGACLAARQLDPRLDEHRGIAGEQITSQPG